MPLRNWSMMHFQIYRMTKMFRWGSQSPWRNARGDAWGQWELVLLARARALSLMHLCSFQCWFLCVLSPRLFTHFRLPVTMRHSSGQWTGSWRTRPHALLDVRGFSSVDEWVKTLPRGARRTLAKAKAQNFTVSSRPIHGDEPAPHSVDPLTLCSAACVWRLPCLPFWPLC